MDKNQAYGNLLKFRDKVAPEVDNENFMLLSQVLDSVTLPEIFNASIIIDPYLNNLSVYLGTPPTSESIDSILFILALLLYERVLNGGGVEDGAPSKILGKFMTPYPEWNETDRVRYAVFNRLPVTLLTEKYKLHTQDLSAQKKEVENSVNTAVLKTKENLESLSKTDENLKEYLKKAKDLKSELNFLVLSKAFTSFISTKESKTAWLLACVVAMGMCLLFIPGYAFYKYQTNAVNNISTVGSSTYSSYSSIQNKSSNAPNLAVVKKSAAGAKPDDIKWPYIINRILDFLPLAVAELILLFYFRVLLANYNAANAQLLQLKTRQSVCQFIQDYVAFKKENEVGDLEKFDSLIFSNLMPSAEQIPATFEGLDHLGKILAEFKSK